MHRFSRRFLGIAGLLLAGTAGSAVTAQAQYIAYGLTTTAQGAQQLVRFNTNAPGTVATIGATGVSLTGIDFRPATNQLYGYDGDKLYILNLSTGVAVLAFDVGNTTGNVGFDFNPTVDRIRVIGPTGTNFRINPLDGSTTIDGAYSFAMGDVNFGRVPSFTAIAYTNSDTDPTTGTALYGIDPTLGQLVLINTPNGGTVSTIGSLGIGAMSSVSGFDIITVGGVNTAYFTAIMAGGVTSQLYTVNLGTGVASLVGAVSAANGLQGLALTAVPEPASWVLMAMGLLGLGVVSRRRRTMASTPMA